MALFNKDQIDRILQALDAEINFKFELIIIGGSAAMIFYQTKGQTQDIDTFNSVNKLAAAKERLERKGLVIPINEASVKFGPSQFISRIKSYDELPLKNLIVSVPERNDWALFKVARGETKDIEDIIDLHRKHELGADILLARFLDELLPFYIGDSVMVIGSFLEMITRLFGTKVADSHQEIIESAGYSIF